MDLLLHTGAPDRELAIPATKTVTTQFAVLVTVATALCTGAGPGTLAGLPRAVAAVLADPGPARRLADRWQGLDRLIVAGRGLAYAAALETALKVKETTAWHTQPKASPRRICCTGPSRPSTRVRQRCWWTAAWPADADLADLRGLLTSREAEADSLPVPPDLTETAHVITAIVRGQQLAKELALARGTDPDAPAHLSKVTATT